MLTVKEAIEKRRSIRRFKPDPVPKEYLQQILEAAWLAPSGSNSQPWRFIVVTDLEEKQRLRKIAYNQKFIEEAPAVIVCCADLDVYSVDQRRARREELALAGIMADVAGSTTQPQNQDLYAQLDARLLAQQAVLNCAIGIEHMVLMATALGLGSCWVGAFDGRDIRNMFGQPKNILVVALLPIGYPDQSPPRRPRVPFERILLRPLPD